jgi:3-oxoacyl-[acyl-carrier-protein] synthase-3
MNFTFQNKTVSGLLVVLPANERKFVDDMKQFNFPESRSLKLKEVMGFDRHRVVTGDTCASDLAVHGLEYLFERGLLGRDDFDALILVTQSPDYFMPPTSSVIQGRLSLKHDLFCLDINQGCAGFLLGLLQAFLLLEQDSIRRVVLINADVLSRKVSIKDRNSYPLIGDGASIAVIERAEQGPIFANLKMDGTRNAALMIPAGGFRQPSSPETAVLESVGDNNYRAKDNVRMEGSEVFNFVQTEVPPMIKDLLALAKVTPDDVDYYVFHQPNRFMLQKLADKMKVPYAKMPMNIVEHFGNASGVTLPTVLAFDLKEPLLKSQLRLCLAGFGVGLTWSSIYMKLGKLDFCEMIEFPSLSCSGCPSD